MALASRRSGSSTTAAREHINDIRRLKFCIGRREPNPLTKDLHRAVVSLSAELYTKDVHFLMELIQNAEDNEYPPGVEPTLEFVLTYKDVTASASPATLLVFNNEVGFSRENMDSICSIGLSTKKGKSKHGYIGEKGIGFKSVFLVSKSPHIFSKGYQVRFSEEPDEECGIGYIVPEWVDMRPTILDIQSVYGPDKVLPTTTIILPLRPEKVDTVKKLLSEVHPEILLFLSKVKSLSVRENTSGLDSGSCVSDPVSAISISSETNLSVARDKSEDSRLVLLSVEEEVLEMEETTCSYYIWRKAFPVKPENRVDERKDIDEWVISIAFPFGERLKRGTSSVGIFAFLPTAMVTNFSFIVQADFILASSRETILLDNKWNLGILGCLPSAFVSAFQSYVESNTANSSSLVQAFTFLPIRLSSVAEFNSTRESIRTLLQETSVVPYESFSDEDSVFCRPRNAIRIFPDFRKLLLNMKEEGIPLDGVSSLGMCILHSSLDHDECNDYLEFLGVLPVDNDCSWYCKCIQASNLLSRASVNVYVELLCFLARRWERLPSRTIKSVSLLKYVTWNGEITSCSISKIKQRKTNIYCFWDTTKHVWLSKWNLEMKCPNDIFFLADSVVSKFLSHEESHTLKNWLSYSHTLKNWLSYSAYVAFPSVYDYIIHLRCILREKKDKKGVILLAHLIYHACLKKFIGEDDVSKICRSIPIVDATGHVNVVWTKTLVPAPGSKWITLFGSHDLFMEECREDDTETGEKCAVSSKFEKYVELGHVYAKSGQYLGEFTPENKLLKFLLKHTRAVDLPDIYPPDMVLQVAYSELKSDQALLLLNWISNLRIKDFEMPVEFIDSIRNGKWMKTYSGFNSPNQCFLWNSTENFAHLEIKDVSRILPVIDEDFYMNKMSRYEDELMYIGVRVRFEDVYIFISDRLLSLASSGMSKECLLLLLKFMKCANVRNKLDENLMGTVKEGKWMRTDMGYVTPVGSVFLSSELASVSQVAQLPIVDQAYYGHWIGGYIAELELLGVVVDLEGVCKLVVKNFKLPDDLSDLSKENFIFMLKCIKRLGTAAAGLTQRIRDQPLMRTSSGLCCPSNCFLFSQEWHDLLVIVSVPIIDEAFYGSEIRSYTAELKEIGVATDLEMATEIVSVQFKSLSSSHDLTSANVISLFKCIKIMNVKTPLLSYKFQEKLVGQKWLETCNGYQYAWNSVLPDSKWRAISQFVDLPLIDEAFYGHDIYNFQEELKCTSVIVDFSVGAPLIATGLKLPKDPKVMTADVALLLLQCIGYLAVNSYGSIELIGKLKKSRWLKTTAGYKLPEECILLDPDWKSFLELEDAPFIDEKFYGNLNSLGKDSLQSIGVKVGVEEVRIIVSKALASHRNTSAITRIYRFLNNFKWCPELQDKSKSWLWIPSKYATSCGKWVSAEVCVLHYKDSLFGSKLHVLEKHYDSELLRFFSSVFGVLEVPAVKDYINLWIDWESGKSKLTSAECRSFWRYMIENWCLDFEEILKTKINKLPATAISGADLQLLDKEDVFIPDDLQLKRIFLEASEKPLFVSTLPLLPQSELYKIYTSLGVRRLSESVSSNAQSLPSNLEKVDPRSGLIGKGLIKIILSFLASHCIHMLVKDRHNTVAALLELSVYESDEPIVVNYSLLLPSSKKRLEVKSSRMVIWEKNCHRLLVHKLPPEDQKTNINFVTCFARAISEGLLPQGSADLVNNLCKIIQLGFTYGFKEDAVDILLTTENLELSVEDKGFIDGKFPSVQAPSLLSKRHLPCTPVTPSPKKQR